MRFFGGGIQDDYGEPNSQQRLMVEIAVTNVVRAARIVADSGDTADGMVEVKWDEMVHLRDALHNLDLLL